MGLWIPADLGHSPLFSFFPNFRESFSGLGEFSFPCFSILHVAFPTPHLCSSTLLPTYCRNLWNSPGLTTFWTTYLPWGTELRALLLPWIMGRGTMGNSLSSLINISKDFLTTWVKLNAMLCKISGNKLNHCHSVPGQVNCYSVPQFPHLQISNFSPNFLNSKHCYDDAWIKIYKSILRKRYYYRYLEWNSPDSDECWNVFLLSPVVFWCWICGKIWSRRRGRGKWRMKTKMHTERK